ncbi:hypothetical protein M6B38_136845 [Iris pallida]|uniref:Uncharacterized protein n=1 Tax=Iris pallida TaxID=29817 RepID=A0AAX6FDH0_IRIPA|nr:hypothetical protein M6B38_136845 [Iris pallida]
MYTSRKGKYLSRRVNYHFYPPCLSWRIAVAYFTYGVPDIPLSRSHVESNISKHVDSCLIYLISHHLPCHHVYIFFSS